MDEKYLEEYRKIEDEYFSIISNLPTNFPKIINLDEEKKKFFSMLKKNRIYNPQLVYSSKVYPKKDLKKLFEFDFDISKDIYGLKTLLHQRLQAKKNEVLTHYFWGTKKSVYYAIKARGKPPKWLVEKAKKICKNYKREKVKFKTLTPEIAAKRLEKTFFKLTGEDLTIEFKQLANKMNINPQEQTLTINPKARFTSLDVKRLRVHEIGTHYLRYLNGKNTGIKLLEKGTANYIETEEGLAVYMEKLKGVLSKAQMFIYAGRVLATNYCLEHSFYQTFQYLKSFGFKDREAFSITLRAKRNLADTSLKGGFTKDYVYLSGYFKIKRFVERGGNLKDLFIGKIKVEEVTLLFSIIQEFKNKLITILEDESDSEDLTIYPRVSQHTLLDFI
jgi:hypothetical protein